MFAEKFCAELIGFNQLKTWLTPQCPYGIRALRKLRPFPVNHPQALKERWQQVAGLVRQIDTSPDIVRQLEGHLHALREVHGFALAAAAGTVLEEYEFFVLRTWLSNTQTVTTLLGGLGLPPRLIPCELTQLSAELAVGQEGNGFYLSDKFSPELAELRRKQRQQQVRMAKLREEKQKQVSRETGLVFNMHGLLRVDKVQLKLAEALAKHQDLIIAAESFSELEFSLRETQEMLSLGKELAELGDMIGVEEFRVRALLSKSVGRGARKIAANCRRLGTVDLLLAKARLARDIGGCVPELSSSAYFSFKGLFNPLVARDLAGTAKGFQAHDLELSAPVTVITGANMGGKSVALRSIGLAVAMAQHGLLAPARSMIFSPRTFIYYSRHQESGREGLSAFGAEIASLAKILPRRQERGLYLLDEPARSTNPQEGSALVRAIIAWLLQGESVTILATHFPEATEMDEVSQLQVTGLTGLDELTIGERLVSGPGKLQELMNYTLVPSRGQLPQEAIKVAAYLGLDQEILAEAAKLMEKS